MNSKKKNETSEEAFLKNKAKRMNAASKSEESKKPKKKSSKKKKGTSSDKKGTAIKVACTILCILVVICLIIAGMWIYFATKKPDAHINNDGGLVGHETFETGDGTTVSLAENVYTFLALGTDKSGSLTDVIMVANYDINTQTVSLLQIPRDTYVKTSSKLTYDEKGNLTKDNYTGGYGGKINSAYSHARTLSTTYLDKLITEAVKLSDEQIKKLVKSEDYAFLSADPQKVRAYIKADSSSEKQKIYANMTRDFGIKYLSSLIYYNFGIPVDYYAQVNLNGFRGIVDAIGGVEMYVPEDMYYDDPYQDLHINLKKGQQVLNGEQAEDFVRFRSGYARADLARLDAQKLFMSAFLKKFFSASSLPKIGNIITEIQKNLYTNLPLDDMLYFGNKAIGIDLSNGITMTTLPGTDARINGGSYYSANKNAVMELVNGSFNKYDTALPEDRFMLYEVSSTPVSVESSSIADIDNNAPDLGFISQDEETPETDETGSDVEGENEDIESTESGEDGETEDSENADVEGSDEENDGDEVSEVTENTDDEIDSETAENTHDDEAETENTDETELGNNDENNTVTEEPDSENDQENTVISPSSDEENVAVENESPKESNDQEEAPSDNSHLLGNLIH